MKQFLNWLIDTYLSDQIVMREDYDLLASDAGASIEKVVYRNGELHSKLYSANKEIDRLQREVLEIKTELLRNNGWLVGEHIKVEAIAFHQRDRFLHRFGIQVSDDLIRYQRHEQTEPVLRYAMEEILRAVKRKFIETWMSHFAKAA